MVIEINTPRLEIVEIIENSDSMGVEEKINGISTAKNYKSWLEGRIKIFRNRNNYEMVRILEGCLIVYNKFHSEEIKDIENLKLEVEIIGKCKGHGTTEIYSGFNNNIKIKIPIKDKYTRIIKWIVKEVKKEDLNRMIYIIKNLPLNEPTSCYKIAKMLNYDWKDIWKYRTKVYFPIYYFPLKVLESLNIITYSSRGEVTRKI